MKLEKDPLGDRMKLYENIEAGRQLIPLLPTLARIDGRAFHSFTKGLPRPYSNILSSAMLETTRILVKETNACIGYTQSDEITLAWYSPDIQSQIYFNGRICKIVSQLAAQATLHFYRCISETLPEYKNKLPTFDARIWQVPSKMEAVNVFIWREQDAIKNSITMAALSVYSHKSIQGKNSETKLEMLLKKGINWHKYPTFFKRGTYIQKVQTERKFTTTELQKLPPKHAARLDPNLVVKRTEYKTLNLPLLTTIKNKEAVIFEGANPTVTTPLGFA
jgi:tRNA(His) guanylyltransferase